MLRGAGVTVHETTLSVQDFRDADEIFSTGNISKVVPVIGFDDKPLDFGPIARRARAALLGLGESLRLAKSLKERTIMATVKLLTDAEAEAIPQSRRCSTISAPPANRISSTTSGAALANQPALLERTWASLKAVMAADSTFGPALQEMIYIAVSTANACSYCVHSHTAAARAKGMTDAQHAELLAIIGLAAQTNHLVTAMQVPVDPVFLIGE